MTKLDMPLIILAAGASSRMRGQDKLLQDVSGDPLLRLQARRAMAATNGNVLIALPPNPHPRYGALEGLDVQTIPVPDAKEGMNASLRTAFAALPQSTNCAMVLLGDLADLTEKDLVQVGQAVDLTSQDLIWRGATQSGKPGHPIVFHADLFHIIAKLSGDSGGREVVAQAFGRIKLIPLADNRARADLDTPEEWDKWRKARAKAGKAF